MHCIGGYPDRTRLLDVHLKHSEEQLMFAPSQSTVSQRALQRFKRSHFTLRA